MTFDEYQAHLWTAYRLAQVAAALPLEDMLAMGARADAIVPITDPTTYRARAAAMHEDMELLRKLRPIAEVWRQVEKEGRS